MPFVLQSSTNGHFMSCVGVLCLAQWISHSNCSFMMGRHFIIPDRQHSPGRSWKPLTESWGGLISSFYCSRLLSTFRTCEQAKMSGNGKKKQKKNFHSCAKKPAMHFRPHWKRVGFTFNSLQHFENIASDCSSSEQKPSCRALHELLLCSRCSVTW